MTKADFKALMEGGIGNSQKREIASQRINSRPIIGRLGIGMLGVAQITGGFTVTSKPSSGEGFTAHVHLNDFLKEDLDKAKPDSVEVLNKEGEGSSKIVNVGEYEFDKFDDPGLKRGTLIIANDLHPIFVDRFQSSVSEKKFRPPADKWSDNIAKFRSVHSVQELGEYWKLFWEMSIACPVPYVNEHALPGGLIRSDQERLLSYKFKVIIDGIELRKPIFLQRNPGGYTSEVIESGELRIYARDLRFHGYLIVQEGRQLRPDELRGILIRIKNIGIGYYDPSFLDYRFNEGPRAKWLTGEIIVDDGLENALNIDRDSFNRFHPEFRAVQEFVHNTLQNKVFPKVYKQIDARTREKSLERDQQRRRALAQTLADVTEKKVSVSSSTEVSDFPTVEVRRTLDQLKIRLPSTESIPTKKANRGLAAALLAIFEVARLKRNAPEQRDVFKRLVIELLKKW
jgi:hypothetical protein